MNYCIDEFRSTRIVKNLVKLLSVGYVGASKNFTRTYFAPAGHEQRLLKLLLTIDAITAKITAKVINKKIPFLNCCYGTFVLVGINLNQLHSAKQFKKNSDNDHLLKDTHSGSRGENLGAVQNESKKIMPHRGAATRMSDTEITSTM